MESTTAICANATQSYTTSSAHAMRVRKARGLRALTSYCLPWIPTYFFYQLLYVDGQLHRESYSRNVSPVSFLPSYMLNSLPQLPPASTSRHTNTQVGISRLICAYFPSSHLLSRTTVFPQIGDMWNISLSQAVGGGRSLCCTHAYTHVSSSSRFPRGDRNGLKFPHVDIRHPPINRNARHSVLDLT